MRRLILDNEAMFEPKKISVRGGGKVKFESPLQKVLTNRLVTQDKRATLRARHSFENDFARLTKKEGRPVSGLATVIYVWVLPRIDADAPLKIVQDAAQHFLFEDRNDGAIRTIGGIFLRRPMKGATRGPNPRPALKPCIIVEAFAMRAERMLARARAEQWDDWNAASYAWLDGQYEPHFIETGRPPT